MIFNNPLTPYPPRALCAGHGAHHIPVLQGVPHQGPRVPARPRHAPLDLHHRQVRGP